MLGICLKDIRMWLRRYDKYGESGLNRKKNASLSGSEKEIRVRHLRYTYSYDNENRVTSKEAAKWDSEKEAWVPYFKLNVAYNDNEVALSYGRWNVKSSAYDSKMETSVYELNSNSASLMLASTK